jgi:predicted RNA-binding Zn ribbon-like protein
MANKKLESQIKLLSNQYSTKLNQAYNEPDAMKAAGLKVEAKTLFQQLKVLKEQASKEDLTTSVADVQKEIERLTKLPDTTPGKAALLKTQTDHLAELTKKSSVSTTPSGATPNVKPFTTPMTVSGQTTTVAKPPVVKTPTKPPTTIPKGAIWNGSKWVAPVATPAVAAKTPEDFMAAYGVQLALINSDQSLKDLFNKATKENWSADRFKAEMLNTTWATTHAATWQANQRVMLESPATYAASYNRMRETIAALAVKDGIYITPDQVGAEIKPTGPNGTYTATDIKQVDPSITRWVMDQGGATGLTNDLITKHLAELGKINLALPGGQAASDMMNLKKYAGQMGMGNLALPPSGDPAAMGNDYFSSAAQSILLGKSTIETWQADILKQAKGVFSAFAPALDAGQTIQNIAAPYINTLANLLEIPTSQIDMSASTGYGKMVRDAMTGLDPANQKPIALYDFEKQIKARPEWGQTNNARDTIMGGVGSLLKAFGKVS